MEERKSKKFYILKEKAKENDRYSMYQKQVH